MYAVMELSPLKEQSLFPEASRNRLLFLGMGKEAVATRQLRVF